MAETMPPVYAWVPNLIGYARIILTLYAFHVAPSQPYVCVACYFSAFVLDWADGVTARALNQCSKFGAVFDMVIDRSSTSAFLLLLATIYPEYMAVAVLLVGLDISSHYMQMVSATTLQRTHKAMDVDTNPLLRIYYEFRPFMGLLCVSVEVAYVLLYLRAAAADVGTAYDTVLLCVLPFALLKQIINVIQFDHAAKLLMVHEFGKPTPYVYLWVPNLIGFVRVALTLYAFYVAQSQPYVCVACYFSAFVLDWADGVTARALNQCSKFGAVFDMVIDRSSTSAFLVLLALFYPEYIVFAVFLVGLDISSHYMQMVSATTLQRTHKDMDVNTNPLLRFYYESRPFMGLLCVSVEVAYVLLYLRAAAADVGTAYDTVLLCVLPFALLKQIINFIQFKHAADGLIRFEFSGKSA